VSAPLTNNNVLGRNSPNVSVNGSRGTPEQITHDTTKKQHRATLKASGVRPFVLYSLRHTFLTRLGESGCDAWTLARIAGHSSISVSMKYVHVGDERVLDAMSAHSKRLENVLPEKSVAILDTVSNGLESSRPSSLTTH